MNFDFIPGIMREASGLMLKAHDVDSVMNAKPGDQNFVTEYDVATQNALMEAITAAMPEAVFIGEEKDNDPAVLNSGAPCFIIDPIDGTTNFIHDFRFSAISVALLEDRRPVLGMVYQPYAKELFHAVRGGGAFLNGQPIRVAHTPFSQALVGFGTSPYHPVLADKSMQAALQFLLKASDVRRCGSAALDLAYVAAGRQDVYFELTLKPWDYAAGALLVEEAGGVFVMPRLAEPDYGRIEAVLAAAPSCYEDACRVLKPYW